MIIPPPTPVPSVTITTFLWPSPPPFHISPRAATFASFPTFVVIPVSFSISPARSTYPQCRLTAVTTAPSSFTGPGTPTPIPAISAFSIPFSKIFASIAAATSGMMFSPFPSERVLISHLSKTLPCTSNKPHFTVVPPISIPKQYFFIPQILLTQNA